MNRATIVLPSYDRPAQLRECLASLVALDGGPYRVIVVDDGSPAPLAPICAAFGPQVLCIRQENAGPAAARNRGVEAADGSELILFIDDDCRPAADWAQTLITAHAGVEDRMVGGKVINGLPANACSGAAQAILTYSYDAFSDFSGHMAFFTTNNICLSRKRFRAIGGFDTGFGFASEDRDLSFRWKRSGGNLCYADDARVTHLHRLRLTDFLRQQYAYGRGARRFHGKVAASGTDRVELGSSGFYTGLLFHPLRRPTPAHILRSGLICLAHAAMAAGYATEARSRKRGLVPA